MDQRIIDLYDEFTHKPLARRVFMERLTIMVGSAAAAEAALAAIAPNYAKAAITAADDARVATSRWTDEGSGVTGYRAAPKGVDAAKADDLVVVIHENRGLNPHIEDVARRLALEGFVAFAPDLLAPYGGTPADQDQAVAMFDKVDLDKTAASLAKLVADRKAAHPKLKVGLVGFCWGGAMVNLVATRAPDLDAGVAYYGLAPKLEDVPKITAPIMEHLGALDTRVDATIPPYQEAAKKAGVHLDVYTYEGANHAFNNDTGGARYNEAAAKLAWSRTTAFLKSRLMS